MSAAKLADSANRGSHDSIDEASASMLASKSESRRRGFGELVVRRAMLLFPYEMMTVGRNNKGTPITAKLGRIFSHVPYNRNKPRTS
jgi:hypothetical protein